MVLLLTAAALAAPLAAYRAGPTGADVGVDRGQAAREAIRELLKDEYAKESLADRFMRGVNQFVGDLLDQESVGVAGGVAARIVLVAIAVAGVLALVAIARRTARAGTARREGVFGGRRRTAAEHRAAAEELATRSRWAEAVRERLRAVARDLEDRVIVDFTPGRTAGELAEEAGRAIPGLATELAAAARVFDDVTYGEMPGTAAAYESLRDLDERLRRARPVPMTSPSPAHAAKGGLP